MTLQICEGEFRKYLKKNNNNVILNGKSVEFVMIHKLLNLGISKTPFDYMCVDKNGYCYAFECKQVTDSSKIYLKRVDESQMNNLRTINGTCCGESFIVLLFRNKNGKNFKNNLYIIPFTHWEVFVNNKCNFILEEMIPEYFAK